MCLQWKPAPAGSDIIVYAARGLPDALRRIDQEVLLRRRTFCIGLPTVALPTVVSAKEAMIEILDRECSTSEEFEARLRGLLMEALGFVVANVSVDISILSASCWVGWLRLGPLRGPVVGAVPRSQRRA